MNAAVGLWVRSIWRGHRRGTIFLAVFAGLAAGAVLTAWEYSRRAATVIEHRVDTLAPANGTMRSCPPGANPTVDATPCDSPDLVAKSYSVLAESRYVVASDFNVSGFVTFQTEARSGPPWFGNTTVSIERRGRINGFDLIAGHLTSPRNPGETLVSEHTAAALGVRPGDDVRIQVTECGAGQSAGGATHCGFVPVRVVGVVRTGADLKPQIPAPPGFTNSVIDGVFPSAAWFRTNGSSRPPDNTQVDFRLAPGASLEDVRKDVSARLPGWGVEITAHQNLADIEGLRKAARLQSLSLLAIAVVLLIAAIVFIGQALSRQIAGETADRATFRVLGLPSWAAAAATTVRLLPIAAGASLIAALTAGAASAFGPTGLAGRADVANGLRLDAFVLVVGGLAVAGAVMLAALPVALGSGWKHSAHRFRWHVPTSALPLVPWVGLRIDHARQRRSSLRSMIVFAAAAVAACVAAASLVASLHRVATEPHRYGAPWEYAVPAFGDPSAAAKISELVRADPAIADAAFVKTAGPIELPSVPAFFAVSYSALKGHLSPVIVSGRPPAADDEIAVAPATLAALGKHVGDAVDWLPTLARGDVIPSKRLTVGPFTIVGEALVADGEATFGPGNGIVVTENTRNSMDPSPGGYVVSVGDPSVPHATVIAHLLKAQGFITQPAPPGDVQGLVEISQAPWVIAALVALLAMGALGHGLHTDTRRHRQQLGITRALGFTTGQVRHAVMWRAAALGVLSALIGVPIGAIVGRLAWRLIDAHVGLASAPLTPPMACGLSAMAAVTVATALAVWPGTSVARYPLAAGLRAE